MEHSTADQAVDFPAWVCREAKEDMVVMGYRIPKGTPIMMPPFATHVSSSNYLWPCEFWPERWLSTAGDVPDIRSKGKSRHLLACCAQSWSSCCTQSFSTFHSQGKTPSASLLKMICETLEHRCQPKQTDPQSCFQQLSAQNLCTNESEAYGNTV